MRACAAEPDVLALVPNDPDWDVAHRVVAAVDYLVLAGDAHYESPCELVDAVREHAGFVARFVREHTIQTNVVQRCWALLPLFLAIARTAGRALDLLELGASAGLNLCWDRYGYRYAAGTWGDLSSPLVLAGEERSPFPPELLDTYVQVRRRRGVDLRPLDVRDEDDCRLLLCFGTDGYRRRVQASAATVREHPPELIAGDYVELLPELLADRDDDDALTVVFQTLSTIYLPTERRERVRAAIASAARKRPLAWISTPTPEEHGLRGAQYPLELAGWPGSGPRLVGQMDNGGSRLDWWGLE